MLAFKRITIAIDFDGTIAEQAWPEIGKARPFAIPIIRWLAKRHRLILWTCREGEGLANAKQWLHDHGLAVFQKYNESLDHDIEFYGNDSRKIGFDITIDDKASWVFWPFQAIRVWLKTATIR